MITLPVIPSPDAAPEEQAERARVYAERVVQAAIRLRLAQQEFDALTYCLGDHETFAEQVSAAVAVYQDTAISVQELN